MQYNVWRTDSLGQNLLLSHYPFYPRKRREADLGKRNQFLVVLRLHECKIAWVEVR